MSIRSIFFNFKNSTLLLSFSKSQVYPFHSVVCASMGVGKKRMERGWILIEWGGVHTHWPLFCIIFFLFFFYFFFTNQLWTFPLLFFLLSIFKIYLCGIFLIYVPYFISVLSEYWILLYLLLLIIFLTFLQLIYCLQFIYLFL